MRRMIRMMAKWNGRATAVEPWFTNVKNLLKNRRVQVGVGLRAEKGRAKEIKCDQLSSTSSRSHKANIARNAHKTLWDVPGI